MTDRSIKPASRSTAEPGAPPDEHLDEHLARALELAERGRGAVSPNPLVGAVLAGPDGEVIGEGFHARLGGPHAEVAALDDARERGTDPAGATLYVTLEPCAHQGRRPPCTDAILASGIARVVIAGDDPSEKASGRGPERLRDGGVEVEWAEGAPARAARLLNQPFRKHARTGQPLVVLKSAVSLDGRTATSTGDSRWITGEAARLEVHRWRAELDAIAVGIGTAIADDALLTARDVDAERQPTRVIFDSSARLPLAGRLARSAAESPVIVVAGPRAPTERVADLAEAGIEVLVVSGTGEERIGAALTALGRRGITSMMLEGGATLAGSFRDAGAIDEARIFYAPLLLGGAAARPLLGGAGAARLADAARALAVSWEAVGDDMLARVRMREW